MNLSKAILVIHDWGSALGFHRAFRFPDQIAAIAYMEAVVRPCVSVRRVPVVANVFRRTCPLPTPNGLW